MPTLSVSCLLAFAYASGPTQLLQADGIVPDFRHVAYTVAVKHNVVDVVCGDCISRWRNRAALKSFTDIDDVAAQVVYLCKSRTITGQSIGIDAGIHFH